MISTSKNLLKKISDLEDYSVGKFGKIHTLNEKIFASPSLKANGKQRGLSSVKRQSVKPSKPLIDEDYSMIIIVLFILLIIFSFFIFVGKNENSARNPEPRLRFTN